VAWYLVKPKDNFANFTNLNFVCFSASSAAVHLWIRHWNRSQVHSEFLLIVPCQVLFRWK